MSRSALFAYPIYIPYFHVKSLVMTGGDAAVRLTLPFVLNYEGSCPILQVALEKLIFISKSNN